MKIKVTQDGIARLLRANRTAKISGLYTDKIDTCVVIIIVGEKGITLIHDTGRLSTEAILNEFEIMGEVRLWAVAYNDEDCLREAVGRFIEALETKIGGGKTDPAKWMKTAQVMVDWEGGISCDVLPVTTLISPLEEYRRHRINILNNAFTLGELPPDMQYDGEVFFPPRRLEKSVEVMLTLLREVRESELPRLDAPGKAKLLKAHENLLASIFTYTALYDDAQHRLLTERFSDPRSIEHKILEIVNQEVALLKKYKTDNVQHALRRAAAGDDTDDLVTLIRKVDDVDSVGPVTGSSALHNAVKRKKITNIQILIAAGASPDLPDCEGESPRDYARGKDIDLDAIMAESRERVLSI